jgi:hypothetical protein
MRESVRMCEVCLGRRQKNLDKSIVIRRGCVYLWYQILVELAACRSSVLCSCGWRRCGLLPMTQFGPSPALTCQDT